MDFEDDFNEDALEEDEPQTYGVEAVDKFASLSNDEVKKLADNQDNAEAQLAYGVRRLFGVDIEGDLHEAFRYIALSAANGLADGLYFLGRAYQLGDGTEVNYEKAFACYTEGAEKGSVRAAHSLGVCYDMGEGVAIDKSKACVWYEQAAQKGFPPAQYNLGVSYENGEGVEANADIAVYWYEKAAAVGHSGAILSLGYCYEYGTGVQQNMKTAFEHYKRAADLENHVAMYNLGLMYMSGSGCEADKYLGYSSFDMAVQHGNTNAIFALGRCYEYGDGVEQDIQKAIEYFFEAAEHDSLSAMREIGIRYYYGDGLEESLEKALSWTRKAADGGDAVARVNMGMFYFKADDEANFPEGIKYLEEAAEQEYPPALYHLARFYYDRETAYQDKAKGLDCFIKAAELGHDGAMHSLGLLYEYGDDFIQEDMQEAFKWYNAAAAEDNPYSLFALAYHYELGEYMDENPEMAVKLYRKAAEMGHEAAASNLSICYLRGYGVERDTEQGLYWALKGAEEKDPAALHHAGLVYIREEEFHDEDMAMSYFQQAVDSGYPPSFFDLGAIYGDPNSKHFNRDKMLELFNAGAELGNAKCQYALGYMHDVGADGQEQNRELAIKWYKKAATQGHAWAQYNLAVISRRISYETDDKALSRELWMKAFELFKASAENNDPDALYELALIYRNDQEYQERDYGKMLECLEKSCVLGSANAMDLLAYCYFTGAGVEQDYTKAFELYKESAERDHSWGTYNLADCYYEGTGTEENPSEAFKLYAKAYKLGNDDGLYGMGRCYYYGRGVEQDFDKAIELLEEAAKEANEDAAALLAEYYSDAKSLGDARFAKAYYWAQRALMEPRYKNDKKIIKLSKKVGLKLSSKEMAAIMDKIDKDIEDEEEGL